MKQQSGFSHPLEGVFLGYRWRTEFTTPRSGGVARRGDSLIRSSEAQIVTYSAGSVGALLRNQVIVEFRATEHESALKNLPLRGDIGHHRRIISADVLLNPSDKRHNVDDCAAWLDHFIANS